MALLAGTPRRAIITGVAGQDGSYLAEFLVEKGYKILGFLKRNEDLSNLAAVGNEITLEETDRVRKQDILRRVKIFNPNEVYNFAAMSFIPTSWDDPYRALQVNTLLVAAFLEVLKDHCPGARFYQASSSEIFGDPPSSPQDENTPCNPVTPYGVSKLAAHLLTGLYRRRYGMYSVSGILYNHESPRRPSYFVTQKIAQAAAEISKGRKEKIRLGNIEARRDWGFAGDFVRGIWLMLQRESPVDYILATGETHSVRDFLGVAFSHVGLRWEEWVEIDPMLVRSIEVGLLVGNATRAKRELGWAPQVGFEQLVRLMVDAQMLKLSKH